MTSADCSIAFSIASSITSSTGSSRGAAAVLRREQAVRRVAEAAPGAARGEQEDLDAALVEGIERRLQAGDAPPAGAHALA